MSDEDRLPAPPEAAAALLPGEHVLWVGTPDRRRRWRLISVRDTLVALGGLAFAEAIGMTWWSEDSVGSRVLWAVIVVVLVGQLLNATCYRPWRLRRTTYVLTTRRALVLYRGTVRAHSAVEGPREVDLDREGTRVTMKFGLQPVPDSDDPSERARAGVAFECVADVRALVEATTRVARARTVQDRRPRGR